MAARRSGSSDRRASSSACGSMVLPIYLYFVFALAERKNEIQKKEEYRCE